MVLKSFTDRKITFDQNIYNTWDGKTFTIDTENFNIKSIEEAFKTKSSKEAEKMAGMMVMFSKRSVLP
jgi:hypothetical protein